MGKEKLTVEIDSDLMARLRAAGVDPQAYVQRLMDRKAADRTSATAKQAEREAWRRAHDAELASYDAYIDKHGLWCEGHSVV
ncbi:MAG: hypothetical protein GC189_05265 [Alphaproteobacteria bacterium]|nr:hypothetical protein [Alphaproteobacteria bacterium]